MTTLDDRSPAPTHPTDLDPTGFRDCRGTWQFLDAHVATSVRDDAC